MKFNTVVKCNCFSCAVLAVSSMALSAQIRSVGHPNLYFMNDKTRVEIIIGSTASSITATIIEEKESGKEAVKQVKLPPDADRMMLKSFYCVGESFYFVGIDRETLSVKLFSAPVYSDLRAWELIGSYAIERQDRGLAMPAWIIPFKNGKYLFVLDSLQNLQSDNKTGVKFFEASLKNKTFEKGDYISLDFDGHELLRKDNTSNIPNFPGITDAFDGSHQPIFFDDFLVLVSKKRGIFWILDTAKGTIRQKKLYDNISSDQVASSSIINPIIANVCPSPDSSIIIAARPKLYALKNIEGLSPKDMEGKSRVERAEIYPRLQADNLLKYPQIEWWKLDVKEGTFTPMAQPPGDVPSIIEDGTKWFQFKFRVHPDERVTMVK